MYEWGKKSTIRLIEHYQAHPILWDSRHVEFKNDAKKREAWNAIAVFMKSERGEVERKMRSLIFQYNREKKKSMEKKFGDTVEQMKPTRRWYLMSSMSFLSEVSELTSPVIKAVQELKAVYPRFEGKSQYIRPLSRQALRRDSSIIKRPDISSKQDSFMKIIGQAETKKPSELLSPSKTSVVTNKALRKSAKKQFKRKHDDVNNNTNESFLMSKPAQQKKPSPPRDRDEYHIFGEHIACKIRKLPTQYSKVTVEHHINNIIHQAGLGQYNHPPTVKSSFGTSPSTSKSRIAMSSSSNISTSGRSQDKTSLNSTIKGLSIMSAGASGVTTGGIFMGGTNIADITTAIGIVA